MKKKASKELREALLEVVDNQMRMDDPPETKQTFRRLQKEGWSELDAKKLIAQCVAVEIYLVQKEKMPYNNERYCANLKNLPKEPGDD